MRVLLTNAEGFQLSETSKQIYSPGYENPNLRLSEHECLCQISKLVQARLEQEGHIVVARRYDESRYSAFPFDKARESKDADIAIMLALNNSQKTNAQFSTAMCHMIQDDNTRKLFESVMWSLGRHIPIQSRYPNAARRIPYLETCKRNCCPAVIILPFFITDRTLDDAKLGEYIEASAKAVSEAILSLKISRREDSPQDVSEF